MCLFNTKLNLDLAGFARVVVFNVLLIMATTELS